MVYPVDFHSHVLPGMDDGSSSMTETMDMLLLLVDQGIRTICVTPHFYPGMESGERFLQRRSMAMQKIVINGIRLVCGAEVYWFPGIGDADMCSFCIGDTGLLLLEMPFREWTKAEVSELSHMVGKKEGYVVLAHVERYLKWNRDVISRLVSYGLLTQVNSGAFLNRKIRRDMLVMMKDGMLHFLGSDTHNETDRPPVIKKAFDRIDAEGQKMLLDNLHRYASGLED